MNNFNYSDDESLSDIDISYNKPHKISSVSYHDKEKLRDEYNEKLTKLTRENERLRQFLRYNTDPEGENKKFMIVRLMLLNRIKKMITPYLSRNISDLLDSYLCQDLFRFNHDSIQYLQDYIINQEKDLRNAKDKIRFAERHYKHARSYLYLKKKYFDKKTMMYHLFNQDLFHKEYKDFKQRRKAEKMLRETYELAREKNIHNTDTELFKRIEKKYDDYQTYFQLAKMYEVDINCKGDLFYNYSGDIGGHDYASEYNTRRSELFCPNAEPWRRPNLYFNLPNPHNYSEFTDFCHKDNDFSRKDKLKFINVNQKYYFHPKEA